MNPTYLSIQKICTELITQSNWLKASGLDLPKVLEKYGKIAAEIAMSSGKVDDIDRLLADIWPSGFRPHRLHYDSEPFAANTLYAQEDENLCDNSAKLKGFDVVKNASDPSSTIPSSTSTVKAMASIESTINELKMENQLSKNPAKLSAVSKMIEDILKT